MAIKVGISTVSAALRKLLAEITAYINRVVSDGGTVVSESDANKVVRWLKQHGLLDSTELLYLSNAGLSIRDEAGNLRFVEKVYSLYQNATPNDGTQTTELNQPRLVGGIAPRAKVALSNQNGESRYFTHTPISFAADEAWSVTMVITNNSSEQFDEVVFGKDVNFFNNFWIKVGSAYTFRFIGSSANVLFTGTPSLALLGKFAIVTLVATGTTLSLYINGSLIQTVTVNTAIDSMTRLFQGYGSTRLANVLIKTYLIQSIALTPTQVANLHTTLRGLYPEIESTVIGSQVWATRNFEAVATPEGNVIANVTENGAVEKVTNGSFDTDTGWIKGTGWSIGSGVASYVSGTNSALYQTGSITVGKWYKCSVDIISIDAGADLQFRIGSLSIADNFMTTTGTHVLYLKLDTANNLGLYARNGDITIDNFSVQELNWSNATEIYDAVYSAASGTAAEKEYAALKEAAMWCYYNNSADNGAIYGKLYNWYAAKLLDLDMASSGFGWRVPTSADFDTLAATLGGKAVAGGKLKMTGTDYWNSPNTGATNESGVSALGGGQRDVVSGMFNYILLRSYFFGTTTGGVGAVKLQLNYNGTVADVGNDYLTKGMSIRLIKTT